MSRKLAIVLGLGEVGKPIHNMLSSAYGFDEVKGKDIGPLYPPYKFKYMHVCIPQSPSFIPALDDYVKEFEPEVIIAHSTLSPGISSYLDGRYDAPVYYSPVRGNIKDGMRWSLGKYTKYLAAYGYSESEVKPVVDHLEGAGFKVKFINDPFALEWAKLLDLVWYGLNIAFYQEIERLSEKKNFDYDVIREFITSTPGESEGKVQRSFFYGGYIGGHCVIPAVEKIMAGEPECTFRMMLRAVLESNIKRREELFISKPAHHPE